MANIPAYLYTSPTESNIKPPVKPRLQKLPFGELDWENFEKLCVRLILLEVEVKDARQYGVRGDKQEGIDIYSKINNSDKYRTYQCKKVSRFGPKKIASAVELFIKGEWRGKCSEFVLCTNESLSSKKKEDEIVKQTAKLAALNIEFTVWDSKTLNLKLKNLPEIVDDFFHREWVRLFCGEDCAKRLEDRQRLDGATVSLLRNQLRVFYKNLFSMDGTLPASPVQGFGGSTLADGYVYPDIEEDTPIAVEVTSNQPSSFNYNSSYEHTGNKDTAKTTTKHQSYRSRRSLESWLRNGAQNIILGDPGSGKSSLSRFVLTDLLCEEPQLDALAEQWGRHLPIWIPFASWTSKLSDSTDCSLSQLVKLWLESYDEGRLWRLVEQALADERLLLIVDGLDEWSDEETARLALKKLRVFIDQRKIPALLTSRPYGFEQLSMPTEGWQVGHLCSFTTGQQEELSRSWFAHFVSREQVGLDDTVKNTKVDTMTASFMSEVRSSPDLNELAKTPLLLCLLISFKIRNKRLPSDRFSAYREAVNYMIETHPQRRRGAADVASTDSVGLESYEIKSLFAYLAYFIQSEQRHGIVDIDTAQKIIKTYLLEGELGLQQKEARRTSYKLLEVADQSTGLVVKKAPKQIAFFHRVFQEYLAAEYLQTLPIERQLELLELNGADAQWHETILALFSLTKDAETNSRMIERLEERGRADQVADYKIAELLSEIAFGAFNCLDKLLTDIAERTFGRIECDSYFPHTERLLNRVLNGIHSSPLQSVVQQKVRSWFPRRPGIQGSLYSTLGEWQHSPDVENCLWRVLHSEEDGSRSLAAISLAKMCCGDAGIGDRIADLALHAVNPHVRSAALEGLLEGWPNHKLLEMATNSACESTVPTLRLIGHIGRVRQRRQTDEDRHALLDLASEGRSIGSYYFWADMIPDALISGWPHSKELRRECFSLLGRLFHREKIKRSDGSLKDPWFSDPNLTQVLIKVLLKGYPQDEIVARFCAFQIQFDWKQAETKNFEKRNLFHELYGKQFDLLKDHFSGNSVVVEAIEEWLDKDSLGHLPVRDNVYLVGCTEKCKALLLQNVNHKHNYRWSNRSAEILLEGWGMADAKVAGSLTALALGAEDKAGAIAHLIPQIIADKKLCRERLLEILRSDLCEHPVLVLRGLDNNALVENDKEVIDILFEKDLRYLVEDEKLKMAHPWIIFKYSFDPRTRDLALKLLEQPDGPFWAIAKSYENDPEIRSRILEIAAPLRADLRQVIAKRLREGSGDENFDLSLLKLYDYDTDAAVKTIASCGYHSRIRNGYTTADIDVLCDGLNAYMPYAHERRMAAFAGLVTLDRIDVVQEKADNKFCVPFLDGNLPFIQLILENWQCIESVMGRSPSQILTSHDPTDTNAYEQIYFWKAASPLISDYPIARSAFLDYVRTKPLLHETTLLRLLGYIGEKELLLKYCLDQTITLLPYVSAELIGTYFAGNKDVLGQVLGSDWGKYFPPNEKKSLEFGPLRHYIRFDQIAALCEGWPHSPELAFIIKTAREEKWNYPDWVVFFIINCRNNQDAEARSVLLYKGLRRYIRVLPQLDDYSRPRESAIIMRVLHRQIQRDNRLAKLLMNRLQKTNNPVEKANFAILLQSSSQSEIAKEWSRKEIDRQQNKQAIPEVGYDLTLGEYRPVMHILLDIFVS